jgi:hypothetical protein
MSAMNVDLQAVMEEIQTLSSSSQARVGRIADRLRRDIERDQDDETPLAMALVLEELNAADETPWRH